MFSPRADGYLRFIRRKHRLIIRADEYGFLFSVAKRETLPEPTPRQWQIVNREVEPVLPLGPEARRDLGNIRFSRMNLI